jgi:hypothetical protein
VLLGCSEGYVNCDEQDENGCEAAIEDVPTPIITLNEDSEAGPMANFSLSGSESISPAGNIQTYSWTLIQPVGSHVTLQPNDMSENVSFVGNVVGSYSVTLSISDDQGLNSCTPASQTMTVLPSELLHIELSWDTAGLNLDLHLAHAELAINGEDVDGDEVPDPWFDEQFDCWAGNPNPIWGDPNNTKDDPTLHREDSDGWGPELLGMSVPEADTEYRLAVHMPEEEGATPAQASIRVYLWDDLVFERANVSLNPGDLWDVGTLDATQKAFTANLLTGGERVIIPDYPIP